MERVLVTGATGNVGSYVLDFLRKDMNIEAVAAISRPESAKKFSPDIKTAVLDFENPATFETSLERVDRIFLMRPPHISNTKNTFLPFIEVAKKKGITHIVFLSLIGVESNKIVPHYKIEKYILASGIPYTFLRAGFFMQNLNTTHLDDIRNLHKIILPAGNGRTSFVDTRDVAEVGALALSTGNHFNKKYNLTGSRALTYYEVVSVLSSVLDKEINYRPVSVFKFFCHMKGQGHKTAYVIVVTVLYLVTKFGKAGNIYQDIQQLLNREPISFEKYVSDHVGYFKK